MPEIIPSNSMFPTQSVHNAQWPNGNKETVAWFDVITFDRNAAPKSPSNGFNVPIQVKCWMSRSRNASVVYACIWIYAPNSMSWSGRGRAGGYGYCKQSTAIYEAIQNTGIKLGYHLGGAGLGAVKTALENIALALGYTTFFVLEG